MPENHLSVGAGGDGGGVPRVEAPALALDHTEPSHFARFKQYGGFIVPYILQILISRILYFLLKMFYFT